MPATLTATVDYLPEPPTTGGAVRRPWVITYSDGATLRSTLRSIHQSALIRDVPRSAVTFTPAAAIAAKAASEAMMTRLAGRR